VTKRKPTSIIFTGENMKNKKWLTYTAGILLTLIVLAAVGGAGFRIGMMQNASFARPSFAHNLGGGPQVMMQGNFQDNRGNQAMQGNFQDNRGPQAMQGNFQNRGFDNRRGGMSFFPPIFGLIRLVVLGLLIWLGYKLVKKSGWRLSLAKASSAPVVEPTPNVEVEEKKAAE
jgi:hypothetical protein